MSGHRYWRIIDVKTPQYGAVTATEVRFLNKEGVNSNNASKISHANQYDIYSAANLVDGNNYTFSHSKDLKPQQDQHLYWIKYDFGQDVNVTAIKASMRPQPDSPQWWLSARLEYSDDDVAWHEAGLLFFSFFSNDAFDNVAQVIDVASLIVSTYGKLKSLNIYTVDESGSISGVVQEKGLPIKAEVALHDRLTRKTVAIAWSDSGGNYSFNGLDKNREYYAEALHPTRKFNLVGQDGLKSGMTA